MAMEQEPTNIREYAIEKQRALVVSLRSQLIKEESVLNRLISNHPPILNGVRPTWDEYVKTIL